MKQTIFAFTIAMLFNIAISTNITAPTQVAIVEDDVVFIGQAKSTDIIVLASIVEDDVVF